MPSLTMEFALIGGGIIGLATALDLQTRHPSARITVLEKERAPAMHQTGRNSGVIHAGVYYAPSSLKAQFCALGVTATRDFCAEHDIPTRTCGKLIVATDPAELPRMASLESRARANGIQIERLSGEDARRREPNIAAIAALFSPSTGIVDYGAMALKMAHVFTSRGGKVQLDTRVTGGAETATGITLITTQGTIHAGKAVFCAGLHADRMAHAFGAQADFRIIPFRGDYFAIRNQPDDLVHHLIYPVPDPARPFLGVHLTRKMTDGFTVGPSAVLAGAREGYGRFSLNPSDLASALAYPGFWRLLGRNAGSALDELGSAISRRRYLKKVQRYCPRIGLDDLAPYKSGVRAQAVAPDGRIIDDFLFAETAHALHVCNAPSPAATSAIPIARHITDRILA
jgi:L-2-hydroxyglutarate oxidase